MYTLEIAYQTGHSDVSRRQTDGRLYSFHIDLVFQRYREA